MRINLASNARELLGGPLRFGDLNQIWAVQVLADLAELEKLYSLLPEKARECESCKGEGERACGECGHRTACGLCGGSGRVIIQFDETEWIDTAHLRKHLGVMRDELAALGGEVAV